MGMLRATASECGDPNSTNNLSRLCGQKYTNVKTDKRGAAGTTPPASVPKVGSQFSLRPKPHNKLPALLALLVSVGQKFFQRRDARSVVGYLAFQLPDALQAVHEFGVGLG